MFPGPLRSSNILLIGLIYYSYITAGMRIWLQITHNPDPTLGGKKLEPTCEKTVSGSHPREQT